MFFLMSILITIVIKIPTTINKLILNQLGSNIMKLTWCPTHQGPPTSPRVEKEGVVVWEILT
jgi:hypothetical protein